MLNPAQSSSSQRKSLGLSLNTFWIPIIVGFHFSNRKWDLLVKKRCILSFFVSKFYFKEGFSANYFEYKNKLYSYFYTKLQRIQDI